MKENIIYSSEYIAIIEMDDGYYIRSFKKGMSLDQFNKLISDHPELKITSIMNVRNVLINAPMPPQKFAEGKERITIELSEDGLRAYVTLCVSDAEINGPRRADLFKEILQKMKGCGITYGIKNEVLLYGLSNNTKILVAQGIPPINGEDSVIRLYELKEAKPETKEDGNVDHYELNLINRVSAGDWIGERIDPTMGRPGKTVKGSVMLQVNGKELPLFYDKNTIREEYREGITTLYARINGAVHYDGDRIGISNHLEIEGNIDFKTGNINFDGYLTVKGTIEDGFSITASKDIEILSDYGVGGVKDIISNDGSIYIKGGIAGNNKATIYSKKNIYTKFVSDTNIICDGSVHIGFYCLNSNIRAKEVILDSSRGQIIGGNIQAEFRVVASIIGSPGEKRTYISVDSFDRRSMKQTYDDITAESEDLKIRLAKAKAEVSVYGSEKGLSKQQIMAYENIRENYFSIRERLKQVEEERKALSGYLRTRGEGEIAILKKVYPNTQLTIKKMIKEITKPVMSTSYCLLDGEIKEI